MISGLHPLLREAVTKADINFKLKEERGQWHKWRAADENSVPPWWEAGAEYVWEVLLAYVNAFFQHTPAVDFERVARDTLVGLAGETLDKKLKPYESAFDLYSKPKFVSFAQRELAKRLAKLSRERWQNAMSHSAGTGTGPTQSRLTKANRETLRRRLELLKKYRRANNLTMADLARHSTTSVTAIYGMAHGDRKRYGEHALEKLLKTIGVSRDQW